jgi:hypothetical protein
MKKLGLAVRLIVLIAVALWWIGPTHVSSEAQILAVGACSGCTGLTSYACTGDLCGTKTHKYCDRVKTGKCNDSAGGDTCYEMVNNDLRCNSGYSDTCTINGVTYK